MSRLDDLRSFYDIPDLLEERLGGKRILESCDGKKNWPERRVYFFFESGEDRSDSGHGLRVTRVGTHALTGGNGLHSGTGFPSTGELSQPGQAITGDPSSGCWWGRRSSDIARLTILNYGVLAGNRG